MRSYPIRPYPGYSNEYQIRSRVNWTIQQIDTANTYNAVLSDREIACPWVADTWLISQTRRRGAYTIKQRRQICPNIGSIKFFFISTQHRDIGNCTVIIPQNLCVNQHNRLVLATALVSVQISQDIQTELNRVQPIDSKYSVLVHIIKRFSLYDCNNLVKFMVLWYYGFPRVANQSRYVPYFKTIHLIAALLMEDSNNANGMKQTLILNLLLRHFIEAIKFSSRGIVIIFLV